MRRLCKLFDPSRVLYAVNCLLVLYCNWYNRWRSAFLVERDGAVSIGFHVVRIARGASFVWYVYVLSVLRDWCMLFTMHATLFP